MILSNVEVFAALDSGRLRITPEPRPRRLSADSKDDYCPFDTHAVDLTLGSEITVPETGTYAYDLMQRSPLAVFIERNSRHYVIDEHSHYVLERGAPRKSPEKSKGELIQLRVNAAEKRAFMDASDLDGKKLSEWVRDRLRRLAREELEARGRAVAFLLS